MTMAVYVESLKSRKADGTENLTGAGNPALLSLVEPNVQSISLEGVFVISGITSVWPSDDTFSIRPSSFQNVRSYRLTATITSGAAANGVCKYATDADTEALAESMLNASPVDPNTQVQTSQDLVDGVPSEWKDISERSSLPPLIRVDFQASSVGDSWTVKLEAR